MVTIRQQTERTETGPGTSRTGHFFFVVVVSVKTGSAGDDDEFSFRLP